MSGREERGRAAPVLALVAAFASGCATQSGVPTPADPATQKPSLYTPVVAPGTLRLSTQEAERRLRAAVASGSQVHTPGRRAFAEHLERVAVEDDAIRLHLAGKDQPPVVVEHRFSDPPPWLEEQGRAMFRTLLLHFDGTASFTLTFAPDRIAAAREVMDVVANLRSTPEEDPALVARFDAAVPEYRARRPKPELPQEARRYKVQAELAVEERRFSEAADLFQKALSIAPWWPEGHYNRSLVLGEQGRHALAIRSMKRYLALVPEAPDAQAAQDRIYAWEAMAQRRAR